jgi:hypothetical protein
MGNRLVDQHVPHFRFRRTSPQWFLVSRFVAKTRPAFRGLWRKSGIDRYRRDSLQLIRSFVRYARAHRSELPGNAVVVVFRALREAYPCRAEHGD